MSKGQPPCNHPGIDTHVRFVCIEDTGAFSTEIHIRCSACHVRFRWIGLEMGGSTSEPMTSVDGFELRAPLVPDAHMTSVMAGSDTGFPTGADR